MPNWCYNRMTVTGDEASLHKLTDAISAKDDSIVDDMAQAAYDLTVLHPVPADTDWYSWCWENWGTKWPPRIQQWDIENYSDGTSAITAYFETAWSPATQLMKKVSEAFPTLVFTITSDEEGMGFAVCEAFHGGALVASAGSNLDPESLPTEFSERLKAMLVKSSDVENEDSWQEQSDLFSDVLEFYNYQVEKRLGDLGLYKVGSR